METDRTNSPARLATDFTSAIRWKNIVSSISVVAGATGLFLLAPYHQTTLDHLYGPPDVAFTGSAFLIVAALAYAALLCAWYLLEPWPEVSKSLRFVRLAWRCARAPVACFRQGLDRDDRVALLATLLKGFFAPLMLHSLMTFFMAALDNVTALATGADEFGLLGLFNRYGYWLAMQVILFVDVGIFTVGYLVESKRLGNEIRSVDPTIVGWLAALMCYPPFNLVSAELLGSPVSDFPHFEDPTVHVALNVVLLGLMGIYASASVALGLKASNLTHRGIIARGPYSIIRHPAYVTKNLAWWIGASPLVMLEYQRSTIAGLSVALSMLAWTSVYMLRALTEEDHLRKVDAEYDAYAARVRYRFVPGVI
jgi:protein-S-isoprenylcysteine O-methyltransferase Ste14